MNFDLTDDQEMMRAMFARFLDENSSMARVRAADASGFDVALWHGLAELGAFSIRVPAASGGLGMGLFDAALLMEEAGRTLVLGPLAETLVVARLLALLGESAAEALVTRVIAGEAVVSIALHDIRAIPRQWVAGGSVVEAVVARDGDRLVLVSIPGGTPTELDLAVHPRTEIGSGADAIMLFERAVEEWKLLVSAGLTGLGREALRRAAAYAGERRQFGQFIGQFQGVSHPLADQYCLVDGGRLLLWKTIRAIADGDRQAGALISLCAWWNAEAAATSVARSLHSFGGYGLTTEYDIHLFNLRAKTWPLVYGDPRRHLEDAGTRLYGAVDVALPDVGDLPVDFDLGSEARAIGKEIDAFFASEVSEAEKAAFHYSWDGYNPRINRKLADAGLLFLGWPKVMGGRGVGPYAKISAMEAFEATGYNNPAHSVTAMVGAILHRFGSDEVKATILPRMISGELIASLGFSEPGSGSDVFAAQCRSSRQPDGTWRISGTKMWTSGANIADHVFILTRSDPGATKHRGLTMFILPLDAEGVSIQGVATFMDERTNITFYDDVAIPDSYRVGPVDEGATVMAAGLELEHGGGFANVQRAMLTAAESLCRCIRRGDNALIDEPHARQRLARSRANLIVSELFGFRAVWGAVNGKHLPAAGPMAKMFSSERFQEDSRDLLDLTAPLSLATGEGPAGFLNQCYRHAQATTIYGGTSEVHRSMIAEKLLGMPRSRA
jgi:alkylation response protein AidB-like acyl-CoA dehydrogenase